MYQFDFLVDLLKPHKALTNSFVAIHLSPDVLYISPSSESINVPLILLICGNEYFVVLSLHQEPRDSRTTLARIASKGYVLLGTAVISIYQQVKINFYINEIIITYFYKHKGYLVKSLRVFSI